MPEQQNPTTSHILYQVDDVPPNNVAISLAAQTVALILTGIVLTPIIALDAAGLAGQWADWVVFAALLISGATTILQARPIGLFGAGHVLFMGTSGAFIAVSIAALEAGGLPLLGSLVLCSAMIQFVLAARLSLFRSIITPTVGGTIICLIAVTVMPLGFSMVSSVPTGTDANALAPIWTAITTFIVILLLTFYTSGKARLWAPMVGILVGFAVAYPLGLVNLQTVWDAAWIGLPKASWPGLDFSFEAHFWALLPAFTIVTIVGALETYGDGIAIQEISNRTVKTTDYRVVQGAVNADGLGNLLSGLACTLPNTTYSTSISVVDLTGVASRRVGVYGGLILLGLAFLPKLSALLQAIPGPVAGAFILIFLILLFAHGIRLIVSEGLSFDNGIVFGVSFWLGVGFQNQQLFNGLLPDFLASLLNNGMTAGGLSAIVLSWMVSMKNARSLRKTVPMADTGLQQTLQFISDTGDAAQWRGDDLNRLLLVAEEAFVYLRENSSAELNQLTLKLRVNNSTAELEMVSAPQNSNVETLLRELGSHETEPGDELRLAILKQLVDDLRHEQFSNVDFLGLKIHRRALPVRYA